MPIVTLERILASTACPAFATDGRGRLLGLNGAAEALLGYDSASIRGRLCREVFAGRDRFDNLFCLERCALREMVKRGEPVNQFELSLKTASGAKLGVAISVFVVSGSKRGRDAMLHLFRPVQCLAEMTGPLPNRTRCNGLTQREHEILALLASGKHCHDIARAMNISLVTVRNHLKRIYPKLQVHSQAEAVSLAFRNKLV
jgi:PAS domain S-box-containing protein